MKERTTRSLLRSVALVGAMAAGATAFGDSGYLKEWNGDIASGDWSSDANWITKYTRGGESGTEWVTIEDATTIPEGTTFDQWRVMWGKTVTFSSPVVGDSGNVHVEDGTTTFASDGSEEEEGVVNGLSKPDAALDIVGAWWEEGGNTVLEITSGAYSFREVWVNNRENNHTATLTLNGGTLSADTISGTGTLAVGANGGTIDGECTISVALTGSGTLTKTGDGMLILENASGFTGKIAVAEDGGSVTSSVLLKAGPYTAVTESGTKYVYSYDADWAPPVVGAWAAVKTMDFQATGTAYRDGWTKNSDMASDWARVLRPGTDDSYYFAYYAYANGNIRGTKLTYVVPNDTTLLLENADAYKFELDWFATIGYNGRTDDDNRCILSLYAGDDFLFSIDAAAVYNGGKDGVDAIVYGSGSVDTGARVRTAPRGSDSNDANRNAYWYHVSLEANELGAYLTVSKQDGTVVVDAVRVSDYALPTKIYAQVTSRLQGDQVIGGLDDVVFSVPAVATTDGVGYTTLAAAVAAATSESSITLYDNVTLTESVTLPWGSTLDLNGYRLTTATEGVSVAFDDGVHYITSTTADGVTTFTGVVAVYGGTFVWTGAAEDKVWATPGNWEGGAAPDSAKANVYIPAAEDDEALTITCAGSGDFTGYLTIAREVTLTGNGITLSTVKASGDYALTLDGGTGTFYINPGDTYAINTDLCVENNVVVNSDGVLELNGKFLGDGDVTTGSPSGNSVGGIHFHGDTSGFEGSYSGNARADGMRDGTQFLEYARGSETAAWTFGGPDNYLRCALRVSNTTYYFGSLNTVFGTNLRFKTFIDSKTTLANATLVIGGRADSTSNFGGTLWGTNNKIVKVGDTSTLNVTLTETAGEIEAEAGTLNLKAGSAPAGLTITGRDAIVTVDKTVGTTTETEGETEGESTSTFTPFVPVLSDTLAATYVLGETVGENVTTYAVRNVAEVGGVGFKTIDEAKEALTEDNDTITLLCSTPSALTIGAGETVKIDKTDAGYTYGGLVSGDLSVTTSTEGTVETVSAVEGVAAVNGTWYPTFDAAYAACLSVNNPTLTVKVGADFVPTGMTASKGLYKIEFVATTEDPITISLTDGTYAMNPYRIVFPANATLSAVSYSAAILQGGTLNIPEGVTLQYYSGTFDVAAITGSGTLKVANVTNLGDMLPTAVQTALKNSAWQGTLEIANSTITTSWKPSDFSNSGSSIRFNGVTTYLYSGTTTLKGVEITGDGLTVNGDYSEGTFTFAGALSGDGTLTAGLGDSANGTTLKILKFVGDLSAFAGSVAFEDDSNVCIQLGSDNGIDSADKKAYQIVLCEGATMTVAADKSWTANDFVVHGDLTLNGPLVDRDAAEDAATTGVVWNNHDAAVLRVSNPSYCTFGNKANWRGTYVIAWAMTDANDLNSYGNSSSMVAIAADFASRAYLTESNVIAPTVRLDTDVTIKNGSARAEDKKSEKLVTFTKLTGSGNLTTFATSNTSGYMWYAIGTLDNYTGTLTLSNRSRVDIAAVNVAEELEVGALVVKATVGTDAEITGALAITQNGTELPGKGLEYKTVDGVSGLYLVEKSNGYDGGDGSSFTIDSLDETTLKSVFNVSSLTETVEGKTFTYAQAFALGLISQGEGGTVVIEDLTATIEIVDGNVVVSIGSTPEKAYTVTCNVYEKASLTADWPTTPTATYVVGSEEEAAGFTPASPDAGFYKVGVTISDKDAQVGNEAGSGAGV